MARKKGDALKATVSNDDPDSNLKFNLATFPINDLLNSDSFISLYPDVLDIIFFNPEIVEVLKKFETSAGFVCHISSLKEVKLSSWLGTAVTSNKSENEMRATVEFLRKYIETQLFNALLRNTHSDEDTPEGAIARANLDPQEYFDEVASVCAEAIAKSIVPEKVKPQLFNSSVEYSIYPISESVAKNNMLKHVGILVTLAGNIGLEKMGGSLFKKGKINVLVDITLKVVVFNSYIFSKRGLTLILNGIREREKRDRQVMLDEEIERAQNSVDGWSGRRWETEKKDNSLIGKIADLANQKFNDPLAAQVEATATSVTYGLNKQL